MRLVSVDLALRGCCFGLLSLSLAATAAAYSPGNLGFEVRVGGELTSLEVMGVFVLPGETLTVEIAGDAREEPFRLLSGSGEIVEQLQGRWRWRAPERPGLYPLRVIRQTTGREMKLNVFVLVREDSLAGEGQGGYRIGAYPQAAFRNLAEYRPPRGFVEVTEENQDVQLAPHFTLRQFVCKQPGAFPKYVVLRERLLLKLEWLLEELNDRGHEAETFFVMSGYRTPAYNRAIGNVTHSRHIYGDAADIFIDEDGDGRMDDLNRDGSIDLADVDIVSAIIEASADSSWYHPYTGGLGRYATKPHRGPFLHVDTRGYRARW